MRIRCSKADEKLAFSAQTSVMSVSARGMCAQVQYSLLDRRPENFMIPYCREQGIQLLPYGTVAGGFLSERYLGLPASKCAHNPTYTVVVSMPPAPW